MNLSEIKIVLTKQSDAQLIHSLERLSYQEKRTSVLIILHLIEVKKRRLALKLGYKSIFSYCEEKLQMDPGTIATRMQIAGKCLEFPELLGAIVDGKSSRWLRCMYGGRSFL